MSTNAATTVADLAAGDTAIVSAIEGSDEISIRLMEMGIIPGVELSMIGSALLGDPIELELRGYRLSIRKSEAVRIAVSSK